MCCIQVLKVYLIQVEQQEPFRLNLREVYSIDHATRVLTQETIYGLTEETDPALITLSITYIYPPPPPLPFSPFLFWLQLLLG